MIIKRIIKKILRIPFNYWCWKHNLNSKQITVIGGYPQIIVKGKLNMGEPGGGKFVMVNSAKQSTLGINRKCKVFVYKDAILTIKGVVSMSNTVIVATKEISFGDNVMIGGGVTIVDSDFHSMNFSHWNTPEDVKQMKRSPVYIGNNVFIGMNSIILKGVAIGDGSIIAAGSVVSKNVPSGEVWGGNPARFLKKRKTLIGKNVQYEKKNF